MKCGECGSDMEPVEIPVFGDGALGTLIEFWKCYNCGNTETEEK